MSDYHGYRYLSADMFVSYCSDLKVDLDPFHSDLELYEQEGVIFPVARITKPKEYILKRNQFDETAENFGKKILDWEKLETLLFGNSDDIWHDFDRAFQNGDNEFIVQPQLSDFQGWKSYYVEIEHSSGQKYLAENVSHYYHYWQVHQVYELQQKYPIYSKFNWVFKKIKEDDSAKADWLFPGSPAPITNFYGRSRLFDVLSFYIHLYWHERKNTEYPSEEFSLKMKEHTSVVLTYLDIEQEELFDFLLYLLDLERNYRSDEKYLLANEVKKDQTYLIGLITYASSKTFDDIQNYFRVKVPYGELNRIRHLSTSLLVQDKAKDDLRFLLKQYNNLFSNSQLNESDVTNLVGYTDKV